MKLTVKLGSTKNPAATPKHLKYAIKNFSTRETYPRIQKNGGKQKFELVRRRIQTLDEEKLENKASMDAAMAMAKSLEETSCLFLAPKLRDHQKLRTWIHSSIYYSNIVINNNRTWIQILICIDNWTWNWVLIELRTWICSQIQGYLQIRMCFDIWTWIWGPGMLIVDKARKTFARDFLFSRSLRGSAACRHDSCKFRLNFGAVCEDLF